MWRPKFTAAWTPREWAEFWLTSFIGFFTFVNAVAAVAYYCTYRQSSAETSRQTDRLICAANIQAQAAQNMVVAASTQAAKMTELASHATEQAKFTNQLAVQAKKQADVAQAQLEIAKRPWIYPENLDMNASHGPVLTLNNAGSSAGIAHQPRFAFFRLYKPQIWFWDKNDPIPEDICRTSKDDSRFMFPVLPKVPFDLKYLRIGDIPRKNENLTGPAPYIVGCIAYYGTNGEGPYYTKVVYFVERNPDGTIKSVTRMDIATK